MFTSFQRFPLKTCAMTCSILYMVLEAYNKDWDVKLKEFMSKIKVAWQTLFCLYILWYIVVTVSMSPLLHSENYYGSLGINIWLLGNGEGWELPRSNWIFLQVGKRFLVAVVYLELVIWIHGTLPSAVLWVKSIALSCCWVSVSFLSLFVVAHLFVFFLILVEWTGLKK